MRSLIDILDLSVEELDQLIITAKDIIDRPEAYQDKCAHKKLATLFFEPSTRTRLSFEAAMLELGGSVIGFSEASSSSAAKGESIADTAKIISCYADIIAMRHPKEGAPYVASRGASIPVINAGDGGHQHPTQTLADLLTIHREMGRLTPAATAPSLTILNNPTWLMLSKCVPPHNSMLYSPTCTQRTTSPYFSPNNAVKPNAFASSIPVSNTVTGIDCSTTSFTFCSTSANSSAVTALI